MGKTCNKCGKDATQKATWEKDRSIERYVCSAKCWSALKRELEAQHQKYRPEEQKHSAEVPQRPPLQKIEDSDSESEIEEDEFTIDKEMPSLIPIEQALDRIAVSGAVPEMPALIPIEQALGDYDGDFDYNSDDEEEEEIPEMPGLVPIKEVFPELAASSKKIGNKLQSLRAQLRAKMTSSIDALIEAQVPDSVEDARWTPHWHEDKLHYKCTLDDVPDDLVDLVKHRANEQGFKVLESGENELAPIGVQLMFSL